MENLCGKCNACCTALRIDKKDIFWKAGDKEAGETCEKLCDGKCSVYDQRPGTCERYECLWLQLSKLLDDWSSDYRPDNLKVIVSTYYYKETNKFTLKIKELEPNVLDFNNISATMEEFLSKIFKAAKQQKGESVVLVQLFGQTKAYELKHTIGG